MLPHLSFLITKAPQIRREVKGRGKQSKNPLPCLCSSSWLDKLTDVVLFPLAPWGLVVVPTGRVGNGLISRYWQPQRHLLISSNWFPSSGCHPISLWYVFLCIFIPGYCIGPVCSLYPHPFLPALSRDIIPWICLSCSPFSSLIFNKSNHPSLPLLQTLVTLRWDSLVEVSSTLPLGRGTTKFSFQPLYISQN